MLTTWTDGVFEIEVDVEGHIECEGREWEVGSAPCASFKKTPDRFDNESYYPVIREIGSTTDYFFLGHQDQMHGSASLARPGYSYGKCSPLNTWENFLPSALQLKVPCRVLWFNAERTEITIPRESEWCLTLLSDGRGGWRHAQTPILSSSVPNPVIPFNRESDAPTLEKTSMCDWIKWVKTALQRESDCRFALQFAALSEEQKWQRVLRWKRGDIEEFRKACELIAHSAIGWDVNADGANFDLAIRPSRPEEGLKIRLDYELHFPDLKRAQRLYAWVHRLYITPLHESLYKHACVKAWLEDRKQQVSFYIPPLSAHERMENLKLLIEWAEAEGIDGELKEILNSPANP